jgi:hypothetical protein
MGIRFPGIGVERGLGRKVKKLRVDGRWKGLRGSEVA